MTIFDGVNGFGPHISLNIPKPMEYQQTPSLVILYMLIFFLIHSHRKIMAFPPTDAETFLWKKLVDLIPWFYWRQCFLTIGNSKKWVFLMTYSCGISIITSLYILYDDSLSSANHLDIKDKTLFKKYCFLLKPWRYYLTDIAVLYLRLFCYLKLIPSTMPILLIEYMTYSKRV